MTARLKCQNIFVFQADLLFADVDEGFMSSLSSLAAASKRPIVLITNHNRNPHLERFQSNRLLQLTFSRPKAAKLCEQRSFCVLIKVLNQKVDTV